MKNLITLLLIGFFGAECRPQSALPVPSLEVITKKTDTPSVILTWNVKAEPVMGFVIEKKEGNGQWLIVGQAEANERTFVDRAITATATYYRIRSFGSNILSDYSDVRSSKYRESK